MRLTGARVTLRRAQAEDVDALRAILDDPEVARWWGAFDPQEVETQFVASDRAFVIEVGGDVAGAIQFDEEDDPMYRHAGVDLFIAPRFQRRGLGPEAIRVLARYLFEQRGHHRLTIDPAAHNVRAIRAYERVGFRAVGVMRRYERGPDGAWHDGLLMEMLAEDLREGADADASAPFGSRTAPLEPGVDLRRAWDSQARRWIAWARAPMHDSYWRFHRDQFLDLLPPPGHLTLDVGAGEGRLARELTARGHRVIAVDASREMLVAARRLAADTTVVQADAARLPMADGVAELVVAFMSLQDVDDLAAAVREAGRVLARGGRLCIAIVHPLNSAGRFAGEAAESPFVIEGSYLDRFHYRDDIAREGLEMSFVSEHRPFHDYFDGLWAAGFVVEVLREPRVPEAAVDFARQRRWQRVPLFAHIRARRIA